MIMYEFFPIIILFSVIISLAAVFLTAYFLLKNRLHKESGERHMKDSEIVSRMVKYAAPHAREFLLVFMCMVIAIIFDILSPVIVGEVHDIIKSSDGSTDDLFRMVSIYVVLLAASLICTYLQAVMLQRTGQKILSSIRMDTFRGIQTLSHDQLSKLPVGKLVTRVSNDPNSISYLFTNVLVTLIKNSMVVVGVLLSMFFINPGLTLVVMTFVPFLVLFTVLFQKFSRSVHRDVNDAKTDVNTFLSENLSGMKVIQIFGREEFKRDEFQKKSKKLERAKIGRLFVFGVFQPMVNLLFIGSNLVLFYIACRGYIKDMPFMGTVITGKTVVEFYMYIRRFFTPIQELSEQFDMLEQSFASAEKIFTLSDIEPEIKDAVDAIDLPEIKGEIEFRDVWFAYKPGEWVLKGVSFHVLPGQTLALVGATGSGKSTILSLLCRNYDIQQGQILVDGIDIRTIKIGELRKHFGQMLQDVFLFSGTIKDNIVLWSDAYSDTDVMEAAKYVNADSFINKLPDGIYEEVRERGSNFSAGQRQLLSFARTIIHKPSVMILDEATANIDTETEILIQDSLEKLKNVGTMIIVAHRLSTIQHADMILVMSRGEIGEKGTHQELLALQGMYHHLYSLQQNLNNNFL